MYARVTQLEIDPLRIEVHSVVDLFEQEIVPTLGDKEGFSGVLGLLTPEGKGVVVTLWDTEEQADASESGFYADVLSRFVTFFRAPPGRERYEVVLCELPSLAER